MLPENRVRLFFSFFQSSPLDGYWAKTTMLKIRRKDLLLLTASKENTRDLSQSCVSLNSNTAAAAKSLQLCPTLCDPTDGNPPGSPVPGILQTRTLEWVAISFSNA